MNLESQFRQPGFYVALVVAVIVGVAASAVMPEVLATVCGAVAMIAMCALLLPSPRLTRGKHRKEG